MPLYQQPHRLAELQINGLWSKRNLFLEFHPEINILIGPNGSGKTTVLNLIRYVLTVDIQELARLPFESLSLRLIPFNGQSEHNIRVITTPSGFKFQSSDDSHEFVVDREDISPISQRVLQKQTSELADRFLSLVPAVWLPVTRRLPIPDEEPDRMGFLRPFNSWKHRLESVDQRLIELLRDLSKYRVRLDAYLSQRYKEFERAVLSIILYSEEFDRGPDFSIAPTDEDKQQLIQAFGDAGLLDAEMTERIDRHFDEASSALEKLQTNNLEFGDVTVLPLIPRTKAMVQLASQLEEQRIHIFAPLRKFEGIVNGFLNTKAIKVLDTGEVEITTTGGGRRISSEMLSSGEKQILILLVEALLREGAPAVYVTDEPELSLHIEWQEKLLASLLELATPVQILVATHSPDIVGPFTDRVIQLEGTP